MHSNHVWQIDKSKIIGIRPKGRLRSWIIANTGISSALAGLPQQFRVRVSAVLVLFSHPTHTNPRPAAASRWTMKGSEHTKNLQSVPNSTSPNPFRTACSPVYLRRRGPSHCILSRLLLCSPRFWPLDTHTPTTPRGALPIAHAAYIIDYAYMARDESGSLSIALRSFLTSWSDHSSCRGSRCCSSPRTTPGRSTRWTWLLPDVSACCATRCCGARACTLHRPPPLSLSPWGFRK